MLDKEKYDSGGVYESIELSALEKIKLFLLMF